MPSQYNNEALLPYHILMPLIVLLEGFVSTAVEMLVIRQLVPFVGNSVVVTSLIIGIFLLFLALGYGRGGQIKENLSRVLRRNFLVAGLLIGVGLSYLFIELYFTVAQRIVGERLLLPLVIYLLLILAPIIYLLGQTLPIIMNIIRQNARVGAIAGRNLGVSTLGSFLGAIMTTLILMHYLGVAATVMVTFLLLAALSVLLTPATWPRFNIILTATIASIVVYFINIDFEKTVFVLTSNFANYQVLDHNNADINVGDKILVINNAYSSKITPDNQGFDYIENIKEILFSQLRIHHANILVLGAGGFSLSQGDKNNNYFTYVDVDDQILKAVVPAFLSTIKDNIIYADARQYLLSTKKKYGVIVIDAYTNIHAIPAHLVTKEFMHSIHQHLMSQGIAVFNVVGDLFFSDAYTKRIYNTVLAEFGACAVIPKSYAYAKTNLIYVCQNNERIGDRLIYTDNKNSSTVDVFA